MWFETALEAAKKQVKVVMKDTLAFPPYLHRTRAVRVLERIVSAVSFMVALLCTGRRLMTKSVCCNKQTTAL